MSIERLYEILLGDKPSTKLLENEEELFKLIPELKVCKGFNQNNEWHIYDVYNHILNVVDNTPKDLVLRLAALFHDIGKPKTYSVDSNGIGHFYGHFNESKKIFDLFAHTHNIDKSISSVVSDLIYYHDLNLGVLRESKLNTLYTKLGIQGIEKLYILKRADLLAQNPKYHYILTNYDEEQEKVLSKYRKEK